ncbi:MFS transporter [Pelagerythrobacter aerophilus]|uniref:DHA2 family efflux MFS transporter permease subunit n=1 Tax=Pelagerythrobacter aerophilus TaxID=2306995 RepID=A0A418NEX2_9SPHN|nr:MFS transporter [Pelagerythrobacter aerophilus]RIV75937.1 DHA2 family efflux MFS transporter permease subunit [Pelagerythrobacter aerophilus]
MVGAHRLPCEIPAANEPSDFAGDDTRWVLPTTILGSSLGFIDSSVVNVALPAMQRGLETGFGAMQWVINGYMLTLASLILLGGSAGDRFGRRRIFMIGIAGFAAASLACGLAPSATWLIAARVAQGAAAALLTPASLAIIGGAYRGEARGPAIGTWAAAGAFTTALGPALGGWLVDTVGWRSIFFINLPIAVAVLLLARKLPRDRGTGHAAPLDRSGGVLAVLTLGLLSYGLITIGEGAWTRGALALIAALAAAWLFIRREAAASAPMMPLSLFRSSNFSGANTLTIVLYAALGGALFLLPFLLIEVHGYTAMAAGAAFLPFSLIMGAGSRWSGGLVDRFGARLPLVVGPGVTAVGFMVLAVSGDDPNYWSGFLPGLIVIGTGMTIAVAPLTTTVLDAAPENKSGTASGINNAAARAGSLIAVAALGLAFGGTAPPDFEGSALAHAYRLVMLAAAGCAALGALIAALTISPARQSPG